MHSRHRRHYEARSARGQNRRHCEARSAVAIQFVFCLGALHDASPTYWIATPCGLAMTVTVSAPLHALPAPPFIARHAAPWQQRRHCEARSAVAIQFVFCLDALHDASPTYWIATPCGLAMT
ncbi:hypothetical protein CCR84_14435 [Rhodocyclus purpureus]|nr:hypothetical protein [Rhodocyclus purpureus]